MKSNDFGFTADVTKEYFSKVSKFIIIENLLNENFSIARYSKNLNKIVFIYILLNQSVSFEVENFKRYRRKNKILEVGLNLSQQEFTNINEKETVQLLAKKYLLGIEQYMIRKDFNHELFYKDVKKLFIDNGIITQAKLEV